MTGSGLKVLIISHNPMCTFDNMGKTLLSLFSEFDKTELCQLYIYPSIPDTDHCNAFYRITDKDVLRACLVAQVKGTEVSPDLSKHSLFEDPKDEQVYRGEKRFLAASMFARDMLWRCSRWMTDELRTWIGREKPNCIFLAPGPQTLIYYIALRISKEYGIPIVTYVCDEFYFRDEGPLLFEMINRNRVKKATERLMERTRHIITICDDSKKLYEERFSVPATTVMTGASIPLEQTVHVKEKLENLTYMGGIRDGRNVALAEIGRVLDRINEENGTELRLKVYSSEKQDAYLAALRDCVSVDLCGFVSGEEYRKAFRGAQMFVHAESFAPENIDIVKHSISTKIADILSSGIPLFTYGPDEVASVRYVSENHCAIVSTSGETLKERLLAVLDPDERRRVAENGLHVAEERHDRVKNSKVLHSILDGVGTR